MKKLILALVFILLFYPFSNIVADSVANTNTKTLFAYPVCMTVNGHYIRSDTSGYLESGYTMVPARALADALCADKIRWDEGTSSAAITKGGKTIVLKKNSKTALVNDKKVALDAASVIRADRFFIPVRFVAETFQTQVSWDGDTHTVNITANGVTVPPALIGKRGYTDNDLYWLSRIVHAESQGEPMKGKIAVANVVLNRVKSPLYANNIYDVIFDHNYGVQFTPTINGTIYQSPSGECIAAAKRALGGERHAGESLYFLNPAIAQSFWIVNNRPFFKTIGNHDFYL